MKIRFSSILVWMRLFPPPHHCLPWTESMMRSGTRAHRQKQCHFSKTIPSYQLWAVVSGWSHHLMSQDSAFIFYPVLRLKCWNHNLRLRFCFRPLVVKSFLLCVRLTKSLRALCNYSSFYLQCLIHSLTALSPPCDTPNSRCTACTHSSKALSKGGNCQQMIG